MTLGENVAKAKGIITDSITAAKAKGATFPPGATPEYLPTAIEAIPSGGGGLEQQDAILDGSATEIYTEAETVAAYALNARPNLIMISGLNLISVGMYGLQSCVNLRTVNFPLLKTIENGGFSTCRALTEVNFPLLETLGNGGFASCSALITIGFPLLTKLESNAFSACTNLVSADFPKVNSIVSSVFPGCSSLTALILRSTTPVSLSNANAFNNTPIASGTGYVYFPAARVEAQKVATNWVTYASQIRAIEDYPEITGGAS